MKPAKPPGKATLRDVARRVGVSVATVSNAYNRPDQLSAELRERVLGAARELGYSGPDPLARSLRRGRAGVIGVVYDAPLDYAFADPAAALFLGAASEVLQAEALNLLLLASADAQPVRGASADGFIVYCAAEGSDLLAAVLERQLPTVLVDQGQLPGAAQVGIDDAGGARQAAEYLLSLGHRHIGVVSLELGPGRRGGPVAPEHEAAAAYRTTAERLRAYREAAAGAGAQLHLTETEHNTPAEGERRSRDLLAAHPEITALLCMSDVLAQGALGAAAGLGLRVPGDLSVIGYDDLPSSAALQLDTVWQPTAQKGRAVARALLDLLAGQAPGPPLALPTRLVKRGTVGPPRPRPVG